MTGKPNAILKFFPVLGMTMWMEFLENDNNVNFTIYKVDALTFK